VYGSDGQLLPQFTVSDQLDTRIGDELARLRLTPDKIIGMP
jgi:hypothetical protein